MLLCVVKFLSGNLPGLDDHLPWPAGLFLVLVFVVPLRVMAMRLMAPVFAPIHMTLFLPLLVAPSVMFLTALLVPLFTITMVAASFAALLAATPCPGDYLDLPDGHHWVVASDNELTGPGLRLSGFVADRNVQA